MQVYRSVMIIKAPNNVRRRAKVFVGGVHLKLQANDFLLVCFFFLLFLV